MSKVESDFVTQRKKRAIVVGLSALILGLGTVMVLNLVVIKSSLRFPEDLRRLTFWTTAGAVLSMSWTKARLTFVAESPGSRSDSFAGRLEFLRWRPGLVLLGWWCTAWGATIPSHWVVRSGAILTGLLLLVGGHAAIELAVRNLRDGVKNEGAIRSPRGI